MPRPIFLPLKRRLILIAFVIRGVQKGVSLVRVGFAEKFLVKRIHCGSGVRGAHLSRFVIVVQRLCPQGFQVGVVSHFVVDIGLTAAVYTAAGASHNFNEGVILFTAFYIFYNLSRVTQSACHRNFDGGFAYSVLGFFNA